MEIGVSQKNKWKNSRSTKDFGFFVIYIHKDNGILI